MDTTSQPAITRHVMLNSAWETKVAVNTPPLFLTPGPAPREVKEFGRRRDWLFYYVMALVILVMIITVLIAIYHEPIAEWSMPVTQWLFQLKFGSLVPIGALIVFSLLGLLPRFNIAVLWICGMAILPLSRAATLHLDPVTQPITIAVQNLTLVVDQRPCDTKSSLTSYLGWASIIILALINIVLMKQIKGNPREWTRPTFEAGEQTQVESNISLSPRPDGENVGAKPLVKPHNEAIEDTGDWVTPPRQPPYRRRAPLSAATSGVLRNSDSPNEHNSHHVVAPRRAQTYRFVGNDEGQAPSAATMSNYALDETSVGSPRPQTTPNSPPGTPVPRPRTPMSTMSVLHL